ncbi:MAG: HAD-IIB family hydrolase [Myxococcota bacterium]
MEHYVSLDPSKLRGVVFDIDDTVTRDGILEAEAFSALHRLRQAGLSLVSVTGRPLGWADVVARMWPVDLAVGENGAGWAWIEGGRSREGYFASEEERREHRVMLDAIADEVAKRMPHVRLANDRGARRCDLAFDIGEEQTVSADEIDLLVEIIEEHGASSLVSTVHAHATPGGWDKARGLEKAFREVLSVELSAEPDRWLFVGDSGNDAAAFSYFPLSVGVANVRQHLARLPTPPAYVTDSDRGLGFAELADHICQGRG